MARDIANGHVLVTDRTLKRLSTTEVQQLSFELERLVRELRGDQPDRDDVNALRDRNQRLSRMTRVSRMVQMWRMGQR